MHQPVKQESLSPECDGRKAWLQPGKCAVLSRFEESVGTNGEPEHSLAFYCLKWKVLINAGIRGHIPKVFMPTPAPKIYKVLP